MLSGGSLAADAPSWGATVPPPWRAAAPGQVAQSPLCDTRGQDPGWAWGCPGTALAAPALPHVGSSLLQGSPAGLSPAQLLP